MNLRTLAINSSLALAGAALWSYGASRLAAGGDLHFQPNPLGVKASPYGQVIALAMQGGIENDWHGTTANPSGSACKSCGKNHGDSADSCAPDEKKPKGFLAGLQQAVGERTNPLPPTPGHKFYLRRQAENKLRLAYNLDPSNYANYNSYHLFLTEPMVGTRHVLTNEVIQLAARTFQYCMAEENDPRPALTAASAAANILELMFLHKENYTLDQMKSQLACLEQALGRQQMLTERWIESGEVDRISPERQQEMLDRLRFVGKIHEAAIETISRLSASSSEQVSSSH